ncbi:MAG TPA: VWA domain-containing protein [Pyrinomonadaceae bacterium]|jgi:VWFA-related protein|nr:VWA domain-containing protein [Pyrinomonadaceae bacterium]
MMKISMRRMLAGGLLVFGWLLCWPVPAVLAATQDQGIRADLPDSGVVHIENRRGSVIVEVWDEAHVSILALRESKGVLMRRSPVIIGRTDRSLSISVVKASSAEEGARIDLVLHIPRRARTEIVTTSGSVRLGGLPASLSVQTVSGEIRAEFPETSGVALRASTLRGEITNTFASANTQPATLTNGLHSLRWATGGGVGTSVLLRSESGNVLIAPNVAPGADNNAVTSQEARPEVSPDATVQARQAERRPPVLQGAQNNANGGAGTPAAPDSSAPQEIDEGNVLRVDTELVTLNVSVVDRGTSRGLTGLAQEDFKLYEDGVKQQLAHFESASAPFDLVLLIDMSGSTRDVVKLIRAAALRFINAARPADRIGVITFAGSPTVVSPLTMDRQSLRDRIAVIETPRGDTKLYDALDFSMNEVLKDTRESRRTAIVLMSDGLDGTIPGVHGQGGSKLGYNELMGHIREFDGVLYTLWLNTEYEALSPEDTQPEAFEMGHDRMQEMAEAGGGMFYEVERLEDLAGAYEHVVADLGTVYSLSYRPTKTVRDGRWRAIRVTVARPDAVARGKHGYYAK